MLKWLHLQHKKNHMKWSWIVIVSFFVLSIYNIYFGLFGMVCMITPIYQALKGNGKIHCAKHCPRGSFLGRFLSAISLNRPLPEFMKTRKFKNGLLLAMILVFSLALSHTNWELHKIAFALFRLMGMSFIVGIILGIIYKPRSWCVVCPMGHATTLIQTIQTTPKAEDSILKH